MTASATVDCVPLTVASGQTTFLYLLDDTAARSVGIAATNAISGSTVPVVTAGYHTTTAALTSGRVYYIDPATAGLTTNARYTQRAGVSVGTRLLVGK
jgi:hypothetical protein